MIRVGILTYQNTLNFGAALQCYALFKSCQNIGVDTEIIDYRNENITIKPVSFVTNRGDKRINLKGAIKLLFIFPFVKFKQDSFNRFNRDYIKTSEKVYYTKDEILENPPIYDKYIIGSDQVWNYNINGMDTTYFMDFVKDKRKILTFASSFGLDKIENEKAEIYKSLLNTIPKISVREKKGAEIVLKLTGHSPQVICDPVFLLTKEEWLNLVKTTTTHNNRNSNSIFTYFLNYNTRVKFENEFTKTELVKMKNIKFAGGIKLGDFVNKNVSVNLNRGPLEFASSIYESKYVFTDSFHSTVFAILLNKKFIVFLSGNIGRDSRIVNLLKLFDLEDRIFKGNFDNLEKDIDFNMVNNICKRLRNEGLDYLKENLTIQPRSQKN